MNKQNMKGITLIALVITIIVLLILAGVSIAMLTGPNGLLTQADTAKTKTSEAGAKEKVQIAAAGSYGENGFDAEKFKTEVGRFKGDITSGEEEFPIKVTVDEQNFEVSNEGVVTEKGKNTSGVDAAIPGEINAKIGQIVEYEISTKASEDIKKAIGNWRVFYASDTEMFLISSQTIASKTAFGGSDGIPKTPKDSAENYKDGAENKVFQTGYGLKYNKKWLETGTTDKEDKSRATAYLCDSKNWTDYVGDTAPAGTYAVGGPTKELLALSWDQAVDNGGETAPTKKVEWQESDVVPGGYLYNEPEALYAKDPILQTILPDTINHKGLYNTGASYWLASPSSGFNNYVCLVNRDGYLGDNYYYDIYTGARPLVSIPMSNVQIKDGIVTIGNN